MTTSAVEVEFKCLLLGSAAVGKTCMANRFVFGNFISNTSATVGASFMSKRLVVDDMHVKLSIWDTAGQERYHALTTSYFREAHAAVIVYDITNSESFEKVKAWVAELKEKGPECVVLAIAGNKKDLEGFRVIQLQMSADYASSITASFAETSALTGIEYLFKEVASRLVAIHKVKPMGKKSTVQITAPVAEKSGCC